jgi:ABC-type transport system involved in multi-copper enzyme maturation permease subunit
MRHFDPEQHAPRLGFIGTVAVVAGLYFGQWDGWLCVAFGVGVLLLACYSRQDGFLLFGPFPRHDALSNARSRRTHLIRASVALGALGIIYFQGINGLSYYQKQYMTQAQQSAYLHGQLVNGFATCIGILIPVMTLFLVPGMIGEERSGKRWDVLMATDLRAREILFGKLLIKLWMVVEPVIVLIPVLAILPLVVGLSPELMLLYGTALFVTMLAIAGLSAWVSTSTQSRVGGMVWVVGLVFTYMSVTSAMVGLQLVPVVWTFPQSQGIASPVLVSDVVEFLSCANPIVTYLFALKIRGVGPPVPLMAEALQTYSAGAIGVFLTGMLLAARRLRHAEVPGQKPKIEATTTSEKAKPKKPVANRPRVTNEPLTWWIMCRAGTGSDRFNYEGAFAIFAFFVLVFLSASFPDWVWKRAIVPFGVSLGFYGVQDFKGVVWMVRNFVEIILPMGLALPVLVPIITATMAIAKERSGDTFETLRTTPLTSREMLDQIRMGCLRVCWHNLGLWFSFTAAAVVTGMFRLFPAIVYPLLVIGLMPHLINFALYCSAWASTPARAFRNLIFGGYVWHMLLAWLSALFLLGIPNVLGFEIDQVFAGRTDPEEMLFPTGRVWRGNPRTLYGDILSCALTTAGVVVYWLIGRWVYHRAVGRFARSREAGD